MGDSTPLALFHHLRGNELIKKSEEYEPVIVHPNKEQLNRRHALTPAKQKEEEEHRTSDACCSGDSVIIVPHVQITPNENHLFNRAISSGGGMLADLQRATIAAQAFYAENEECNKNRSPWILKRLYEWSSRAKRREIIKHVHAALAVSKDVDVDDTELEKLLAATCDELFDGIAGASHEKYLQAIWELFHTELKFLHGQLLVLRNVYKEPLKKCQVEGCLLNVEPDLLFGNLEQLCGISRSFCKTFLQLLHQIRINNDEVLDCTELIVQLFERFSKGPSTISAYQAYCINYKATMEYLASIRQKDERFVEFERICLDDERSSRLQLDDLLIAPLQRITRLPLLLREIWKHTPSPDNKTRVQEVIDAMNECVRSIDDSVQWLHNFERLQQLQTQVVWPSISQIEPRSYVPDFLRAALSRQFCENLLAHPRRKLVHEGPLELLENGRNVECYAFLFNDMFLLTKVKKCHKTKTGKGLLNGKSDTSYVVHRQPIPLDACVFCDADSNVADATLKMAFVIIHLTRYYQVVGIYTLQATQRHEKEVWIQRFQECIENYEAIQLKDMLKCTPLLSSISLRRCSSSRLLTKTCSEQGNEPADCHCHP